MIGDEERSSLFNGLLMVFTRRLEREDSHTPSTLPLNSITPNEYTARRTNRGTIQNMVQFTSMNDDVSKQDERCSCAKRKILLHTLASSSTPNLAEGRGWTLQKDEATEVLLEVLYSLSSDPQFPLHARGIRVMKLVLILEHFAGRNVVELLATGRAVIGLLRIRAYLQAHICPFPNAVQTERVLAAVNPPTVVNRIQTNG